MRELSYQLSFKRLIELSTRGIRVILGSTPGNHLRRFGICLLIGLPLGLAVPWFYQKMTAAGFDPLAFALLAFFLLIAFYAALVILRYRNMLQRAWEGANGDRHYRVTRDSEGIRFATQEDEYYLKWHGITRMWLERDGVVVARGPMVLWIADTAFADAAERMAFIREIFAHMSDDAQLRSAHYLRGVLVPRDG